MIGIAIIGYGYWGPNLARCFAETEHCYVAAVVDPRREMQARAAKRFPQARLLSDWRDAIADPTIQAVAVATPVITHFDIAQAFLLAGRHVLVEKPMTYSSAQARVLNDIAAQRRLVLMVGHSFIYAPAVQKIRELIISGEIGDIYYYDSTRINLGLFHSDVNVVWDLAVHDVAILQYIFGSLPVTVMASGVSHVPGQPENMAHIMLRYDGNTVAHLNVNWLAPVKVRQVLIGGSRRMIVWDDLQPSEKIKVYDSGIVLAKNTEQIYDMRINYRTGDIWTPKLSTVEPLIAECQHFIACIRNQDLPITAGTLGEKVVEVLEAATLSMRCEGRPVACALGTGAA